MKIILTGESGFLGLHTHHELLTYGHDVISINKRKTGVEKERR